MNDILTVIAAAEQAARDNGSDYLFGLCAQARTQIQRMEDDVKSANERTARVVRGEFTQICSHCGAFEAPAPCSWEALQKHIQECPAHPLTAAKRHIAMLENRLAELQSPSPPAAGESVPSTPTKPFYHQPHFNDVSMQAGDGSDY